MAQTTKPETFRARQKLLAIPELLEAVLLHLPLPALYRAQRITRHFRTAIISSIVLQQKMYREPTSLIIINEYTESDCEKLCAALPNPLFSVGDMGPMNLHELLPVSDQIIFQALRCRQDPLKGFAISIDTPSKEEMIEFGLDFPPCFLQMYCTQPVFSGTLSVSWESDVPAALLLDSGIRDSAAHRWMFAEVKVDAVKIGEWLAVARAVAEREPGLELWMVMHDGSLGSGDEEVLELPGFLFPQHVKEVMRGDVEYKILL